jgi:hypothetical protein
MSNPEIITLLQDMRKLDLNPFEMDITNPATSTLVYHMTLLNNPQTESKVIVETFNNFRDGGKYIGLIMMSLLLVQTVEYWYNIYMSLLEVQSTEEIKKIMQPLFDVNQDIYNYSKFNLGQSFMKASMHLLWKKLALFNPNIATKREMLRFKEDTPKDIVIGQIAFPKIFAEEIERRGHIEE